MTKRQQAIADEVAKRRDDLLRQANDELWSQPVGYSAISRISLGWDRGELRVLIMKVPHGYEWREYQIGQKRKGIAAPKMRPL